MSVLDNLGKLLVIARVFIRRRVEDQREGGVMMEAEGEKM